MFDFTATAPLAPDKHCQIWIWTLTSMSMWNKNVISLRTGKKNCLKNWSALVFLSGQAVKGILDQSQRRIKTSAPHFTSISPTLLQYCASAVEAKKGRCFETPHTATNCSPLLFLLHLFSSFRLSYCHSTVPPLAFYWMWKSSHQTFPANSLWHVHMYSTDVQDEQGVLLAFNWPPFPSSITPPPPPIPTTALHALMCCGRAFSLRSCVIIFNVGVCVRQCPFPPNEAQMWTLKTEWNEKVAFQVLTSHESMHNECPAAFGFIYQILPSVF